MGFGGSGGGGSSSIAGSSDVTLNNPAQGQVLGYDGATSKWVNTAAGSGAVSSVAGRTGAVTLTKADVGLTNVDNTTDTNKPISSATQTALNTKASFATSQPVARWNASTRTWEARPSGAAFGVVFLSTNDATATAPNDASLLSGDVWRRHPDAV